MGKRPGQNADIEVIEQALLALRRQQTRHALARLSARRGIRTGRIGAQPDAVFQLLDVVENAAAAGSGPTVTEAAAALAVDQPRASRLAAQALEAGLLRREADQADGRRSLLMPTPAGHAALEQIRRFRQQVISEALKAWPEEDRSTLARLLARFTADLATTIDQ